MGTRTIPGVFDCYNKALPDEPMFTLLARDTSAPQILRLWADVRRSEITRGERNEDDLMMCREADECADEMEEWRKINDGTWRAAEGTGRVYYNEDNRNGRVL